MIIQNSTNHSCKGEGVLVFYKFFYFLVFKWNKRNINPDNYDMVCQGSQWSFKTFKVLYFGKNNKGPLKSFKNKFGPLKFQKVL